MTEIDIPPQAKKVLDWVIEETGKPLVVNFTEGIGANMAAGFVRHPDKVQIDISPSKSSTEAEIVDNICHEALHGYLIHKSGYHFPEPITNIATEDVYLLSLAGTMIDDIVVDKILEDLHLNPTSSQCIPQVKREIKAMNKGKDIYAEHLAIGRIFYEKFKVFRYVLAWGILKYNALPADDRKVLSRFMKHFKRYYPADAKEADGIISCIIKHDIFSREGQGMALKYVCELWRLGAKVKLNTYLPE
ncbi:MAG: hypothetical protein ACXWL9_03365 [Syntrophales bacterium]